MKFASLSAREAEVMALVIVGRMNKQIAGEMKLAEIRSSYIAAASCGRWVPRRWPTL
jgi:FixJ family two-component response regulator